MSVNVYLVQRALELGLRNDRELQTYAVMQLYWRQTDEERQQRRTFVNNSVGFTKADAMELSFICEAWLGREGRELYDSEYKILSKLLPKYIFQLTQ